MEYSERFESFWLKYGATESLKQKGSKRKAYEGWQKILKEWIKQEGNGDEVAFSQHVARGYDALIKNRRAAASARQFVPTLPHAVTFINQWRFEEEFAESTGDLKRQHVDRICGCGSTAVKGRSYEGGWICGNCDLEDWKRGNTAIGLQPTLRALAEENPRESGENWRDWSIRVMKQWPVGRKLAERYNV